MSIERLLEKIETDARNEGKQLVADARREASSMTKAGRDEARASAKAIRSSFHERGERQRTKIMSVALAEGRAEFLATQDKLFEEIFVEALREIERLPVDRYRVWLKRIIMENVASGNEAVVASSYDRKLLEDGLLSEINRELKKHKRQGRLVLDEQEAEFSRGVILKSADFVNNLSLQTMMREVRDRHEEEVLKMLFGEVDVRSAAK
jgi:vacuolar-type H+-ATPase subunit E/Vma4